jgi:flagellar protein FliJ
MRISDKAGVSNMKSSETALTLKRYEADEKARKAADLKHMIREFENMAFDLDRQIKVEEDRTHIKDPAHFAYSTFAKSASHRRDNLRTSAEELRVELEATRRERDDALGQFNRVDTTAIREQLRDCRHAERDGCVDKISLH